MATQSSTADNALAPRAVDCNVSPNILGGSCSMTKPSTDPWWNVELGGWYQVKTVRVWAQTDLPGQLNGFR
eukprot:Ihof_evm5s718 gene=Ihof_evmTU5s718